MAAVLHAVNLAGTSVTLDQAKSLTDMPKELTDLPHELLLRIIAATEYSPQNFAALSQVNRSFNELMQQHATSLSQDILSTQFPIQSALYRRGEASPRLLKRFRRRQTSVEGTMSICQEAGSGCVGTQLKLGDHKIHDAGISGIMFANAKKDRGGDPIDPCVLPKAVVLRLYLACATAAGALCHTDGLGVEENGMYVRRHIEGQVLQKGFSELAFLGSRENIRCETHASSRAAMGAKVGNENCLECRMSRRSASIDEYLLRSSIFYSRLDDIFMLPSAAARVAFWRRPLRDTAEQFLGTQDSDEELDSAVVKALQEEDLDEAVLLELLATTLDRVAPKQE